MALQNRSVHWESRILAGICLLDLGSMLFWVSYRTAAEGNAFLAWHLEHGGIAGFIAARIALYGIPLLAAEWVRRTHPDLVRSALRAGILAYLAFYGLGVAHSRQMDQTGAAGGKTPAAYHSVPVARADR